jgi:dinuclear metal center YbgI/SA1388 family protein
MITVADVTRFLRTFAPLELAEEWDNVGLLLGDDGNPVQRVMTCLTVTPASAAEAIAAGAQLIVSHHPILFRATKRLTAEDPEGRMLLDLIRAGVSVYSPHTAFDNTKGGINDVLAGKLGLTDVQPLTNNAGPAKCKVVVFVPDADLQRVADAMFAAGAGNIGQYSQCSFRLAGTGTFFGSDAAKPTIGEKGRREEVSEWRLEAVCADSDVDRVVAALRKAHSYEEPAYDVYPLRREAGKIGSGRVGRLPAPARLDELAHTVKRALGAAYIQLVGEPSRMVQRVAIACGAGASFLGDAARARADVLLTGEARFHDCLSAESRGIALLLPGHHASERAGVEALATLLAQQFPAVEVWPSRQEHDPIRTAQ